MEHIYKSLSELFKTFFPEEVIYSFKQVIETDEIVEFVLILEEKNLEYIKVCKDNILDDIQILINSKISKFDKKIKISLEVFNG